MHVFFDGFVDYIKLKQSDIYIARLNIKTSIDGVFKSEVFLFESNNPSDLKGVILNTFLNYINPIQLQYTDEVFSNIKTTATKYRGCEVIQRLESYNLIKSKRVF